MIFFLKALSSKQFMQALRVQLSDALRSTPLCPPVPILVDQDGSHLQVAEDHRAALAGKVVDVLVLSHTDVPADGLKDAAFRELVEQEHMQKHDLSETLNDTLHRHAYLVCTDGTGYRVSGRHPHVVQDGRYALALYQLYQHDGHPLRWVPHSLVLPADHHGPRTLYEVVLDLIRSGGVRLSNHVDQLDMQFFRSEVGPNTYHVLVSAPM